MRIGLVRREVQRAEELRRQLTPPEQALWACLRAGRLGGLPFRRQQVIQGYIVDFYCHAAALTVEVDGGSHYQRGEENAQRDEALAALGPCTLRVTTEEVTYNMLAILDRIRTAATRP